MFRILRCAQNDKEEARNPRPDRQTFSLSTYRAPPHPPAGQSLRCAQNDVRRAGMMWRELGMTQGALRTTRSTQNDAGRTQNAKTGTGMTGPANVISLSAVRFSPESPEILRCAQNDKEEARNSGPDRQTFSLSTYRAPPHPPVGQRFFAALRMTKRKLGIQDRTGRHSRSQPTELHRTRLPGKVFAALRMT